MAETITNKTTKTAKKKEAFTCFAPEAKVVQLAGSFTGWGEHPIRMRKLKDGTWKTSVSLEPGTYEYRFKVDGQWRNDESCTTHKANAFGEENCLREVAA